LEGYDTLGLNDVRKMIEDSVLPVARGERGLRAAIHDLSDFERSYQATRLSALDELIVDHDDLLIRVIRENAQTFAI
jgi:hypothetical protein